jgi:hypothetical protein
MSWRVQTFIERAAFVRELTTYLLGTESDAFVRLQTKREDESVDCDFSSFV